MNSQGRKPLFGDVLFLFALMAGVIFSWAGCSTTNPPSKPQPVAQSQKMEAGTKGLAKAPVSQSSSLEQLRQGKPVGTAASSPLKDIYFDFDQYNLRADARDILKTNAEWLNKTRQVGCRSKATAMTAARRNITWLSAPSGRKARKII